MADSNPTIELVAGDTDARIAYRTEHMALVEHFFIPAQDALLAREGDVFGQEKVHVPAAPGQPRDSSGMLEVQCTVSQDGGGRLAPAIYLRKALSANRWLTAPPYVGVVLAARRRYELGPNHPLLTDPCFWAAHFPALPSHARGEMPSSEEVVAYLRKSNAMPGAPGTLGSKASDGWITPTTRQAPPRTRQEGPARRGPVVTAPIRAPEPPAEEQADRYIHPPQTPPGMQALPRRFAEEG